MDESSKNKAQLPTVTKPTVLLVDDDLDLCESIAKLLNAHGYNTLIEQDGSKIQSLLRQTNIDVILLDIMLNGGQDGIALCKSIRQYTIKPIIMMSAINSDVERIVALDVGADNYITKPFSARVLLAYINACLRRGNNVEGQFVDTDYEVYEFQNWKLNATARILLSPQNEIIKLTTAEFILLESFLQRPQHVISRDQLLESMKSDSDSFDRSIDILISRLRSKIEANPRNPSLIITMRNAGYSLICHVRKRTMNTKDWQKLSVQLEKI